VAVKVLIINVGVFKTHAVENKVFKVNYYTIVTMLECGFR